MSLVNFSSKFVASQGSLDLKSKNYIDLPCEGPSSDILNVLRDSKQQIFTKYLIEVGKIYIFYLIKIIVVDILCKENIKYMFRAQAEPLQLISVFVVLFSISRISNPFVWYFLSHG